MDCFHLRPFLSLTHLSSAEGPGLLGSGGAWPLALLTVSSQCCFSCSSILGTLASGSSNQRLLRQSPVRSLWQG